MDCLPVVCFNCNKTFLKEKKRINESKKFSWKLFCSKRCLIESRSQKVLLKCSRLGCNKHFYRTFHEIRDKKNFYCSKSCSVQSLNSSRVKKIRKCLNKRCNRDVIGDRKYCCNECIPNKKSKYSRRIIISTIQNFVKENKRIPLKRESQRIYIRSRRVFGTWNNAIKAAGFEPNPVMFANKYTARDGHRCDSLSEKIIDDWFYSKNIEHEINVKYPGENGFTADFKIGNWWVEFFGLEGVHKKYDDLKNRKLKIAKKFNLKLIDLHPGELFPKSNIEKKLNFLIK